MLEAGAMQDLQKPAKPREKTGRHIGILDPVAAAEQFSLKRYLPSPPLEKLVLHHWIIRWNLVGKPPYRSTVLPHPSINLAFLPGETRITGVTRGSYVYEIAGCGEIFGTMFRPGGFHPFYRRPVADLTDRAVPVSSVFPKATDAFGEHIRSLADEAMVAEGEALLTETLGDPDPDALLAGTVVNAIATEPGLSTTAAVARRFNRSERTLQLLFQTYVGVGVKWVIMRYRMLEAAERAARDMRPNWTHIAHELGYADQAHFSNAFRALVGQSPTRYARSIKR